MTVRPIASAPPAKPKPTWRTTEFFLFVVGVAVGIYGVATDNQMMIQLGMVLAPSAAVYGVGRGVEKAAIAKATGTKP